MPLNIAAITIASPASGSVWTAPSTKSSPPTYPIVPGKPTLASPVSKKEIASMGMCSYSP